MWSDNESSIDLLGFGHLVTAITSVVTNEGLLPATIGIFGDWGSGKSSLLQMARAELEQDGGLLILAFNGWLFEGYEDAKTSLIGTILDELAARKTLTSKAKELVLGMLRRINMMRVLSAAGKAAGAYAVGGPAAVGLSAGGDLLKLGSEIWEKAKEVDPEELGKFLRENEPGSALRQGVREFRNDFTKLLEATNVKTLVVMIDDLDRCMPDSIIELLEAIKLFLFVPRTAFLIGADERLVKYAVRRRFPELPGERAEVGRDYLEKLVQFPVRIPPLGRAEMETYINLLFAGKAGLSKEDREKARERVVKADPKSLLEVKFNRGIALELFGKVDVELAENLIMAERIAPVLARGLLGNPRQCKRFLNTLVMRLEMARSRGIKLRQRVLSKVMLLEYFAPEFFRRLAELQGEEQGKPRIIAEAEARVHANSLQAAAGNGAGKGPVSEKAKPDANKMSHSVGAGESSKPESPDLATWLSDRWTGEWLASEPRLADEDLRPYFFFARDRLGAMAGAAQRMSPRAQEMLAELFHESAAARSLALKKSKELSAADVAAVFEALADRTRQEEDHSNAESALNRIFDWIDSNPALFGQLIALLTSLPEDDLSPALVPKLLNLAVDPEKRAMAKKLLEKWASSSSNNILKKAAEGRLKSGK
jgi:hypothetical protein